MAISFPLATLDPRIIVSNQARVLLLRLRVPSEAASAVSTTREAAQDLGVCVGLLPESPLPAPRYRIG